MPRRRFSFPGTIAAAVAFLLAVLPLAAAPALAGMEAARPHDMTMSGMSGDADGPCASMEDMSDHSPGKHAQDCLARCIVAHGAVLPQLPGLDAAWQGPAAPPVALVDCSLQSVASGIDPPPPRQA